MVNWTCRNTFVALLFKTMFIILILETHSDSNLLTSVFFKEIINYLEV